jgi:hypothetical protein
VPVRPRRQRRNTLTPAVELALVIGPREGVDPELGRAAWNEHRRALLAAYGRDTWAARFYEHGVDVRLDDALRDDAEVGCPGC